MSGPIHANPQQEQQEQQAQQQEQQAQQQEQQVIQQLQQQQVWDVAPNQQPLFRRAAHLAAMIQQQQEDNRLLTERAQVALPAAQAQAAAEGAPVQALAPAEKTSKQIREEQRHAKAARQYTPVGDHISYALHEQLGEYYKAQKSICNSKMEKQLRAHPPAFDALRGFLQQYDKNTSSAEKKRIDAENRALVNGYLSGDAAAHNAALKTCLTRALDIQLTEDMLRPEYLETHLKEMMVIYNRLRSLDELLKDPASNNLMQTLSPGERDLIGYHRLELPLLERLLQVRLHSKGVHLDGSYMTDMAYYTEAHRQQSAAVLAVRDSIRTFDAALHVTTTEQLQLAQLRLQADSDDRLHSEAYQSLGLTSYANAENAQRLKDIRDLIAASPQAYAAEKPLFDRLYQQFFRGIDALGDLQLKIDSAEQVIRQKGDASPIGKGAARYLAVQHRSSAPIQQQLDAVSGLIRYLLGQQSELSGESRLLAEREQALDAVQRMEAVYQEQADEALWAADPEALIARVQGKLDQLQFGSDTAASRHLTTKSFFNDGLNNGYTPAACFDLAHYIFADLMRDPMVAPGLKTSLTTPEGLVLNGINASRTIILLVKLSYPNTDAEQIIRDMTDLLCLSRYHELAALPAPTPAEQQELAGYTPERLQTLQAAFQRGFRNMLSAHLTALRRTEAQYGRFLSQLHPEDLMGRCDTDFFLALPLQQDFRQVLTHADQLLDPAHNAEDREYIQRGKYFDASMGALLTYFAADANRLEDQFTPDPAILGMLNQDHPEIQNMLASEPQVEGPGFNSAEMKAYQEIVRRRYQKTQPHLLCGRFAPTNRQQA